MTIGRKWRQQVVAARDKSHFAQARLVLPTRTLKEERNNASYAIVFLVIGSRICSSSWFARNKISLLGHCKTTRRTRFATCCGWKRSGQLPGSNRRTSAIAPASSMGSTQIKTSTTATQNTARQNIVGIPNYNRILFRTIQNTLELLRGTPGRNPASYDENSLGPSPFAFNVMTEKSSDRALCGSPFPTMCARFFPTNAFATEKLRGLMHKSPYLLNRAHP